MTDLSGKQAVITGGSRGIGAASAIALAEAGARIVLTYRQQAEAAERTVETIRDGGGQAWAVQLDVTDPEAIDACPARVAERLDRVDILFNNAGDLVDRAPLGQITADLVHRVFDLNVTSTVLVTQALLPKMAEGSVIINMSSLAARMGGGPGASLYAAAKSATLTLTHGWAKELAPRGIRVFAVAPGIVDTAFHERHTSDEVMDGFKQAIPLGRIGEPPDVARAVVYLAGESHGFMTGVCIDINGGHFPG